MPQFYNMQLVRDNELLVFATRELVERMAVLPPKLVFDNSTSQLFVYGGKYFWADVRGVPLPHSDSHTSTGGDPIVGDLDASARVGVLVNNKIIGKRRKINIYCGSNIYVHAWEDPETEQLNIIISSVVGGPDLTTHNLLESAAHPDTQTSIVERGDIIVGKQFNSVVKWSRLAKGGQNQFLMSDGNDVVWSQVSWGVVSGKPTEFPPTPHVILGSSHSDVDTNISMIPHLVMATKVVGSSVKWSTVEQPSETSFLFFNGSGIVWKKIENQDLPDIDGGGY